MQLMIQISETQDAALSKALAAYNASNATLTGPAYVQKLVSAVLDNLVHAYLKTDLSKLEFLTRFTDAERIAIRAAAATDAVVGDYLELLDAVPSDATISLTDERFIAGVQAMENSGLLANGRSAEILAL